jgi:hypothetical protein
MSSIEMNRRLFSFAVWGVGCVAAMSSRAAAADLPAPAPEATAVSSAGAGMPPPSTPPPPYSLPWQLRSVTAATAIRSDSSVAFYDTNGASGSTVATILNGSYSLTPHLAPLVRFGFVQNNAPGTAVSGSSIVNPVVGAMYARRVRALRWSAFLGGTIPVGGGSGDHPEAGIAAANTAGLQARAGMDNSMFAVNYFTAIVGGDIAYVDRRLTVQGEATLFQLFRVRGDDKGAQSTDSARTNSTMGIHVGYFVIPALSFGAELRYQRWLTTPTKLNTMGAKVDIPSANMDTTSVAIGPRAHFTIAEGVWLRPGISYARVLDEPLSGQSYNMLQFDLPVVF